MTVLVVDDEKEIRVSLKEILEEEGYEALCAETSKQARELFDTDVDLVLLDIKLGSDNGIDLLKKFKQQRPTVPVIMISGHGTVALTAQAFKLGAHEFMEKPLRLIQVRACVRNALEAVTLKQKVSSQEQAKFPQPLYKSTIMKNLFNQTHRLASINEPVVIMGPSGSGKELVARSLHYDGTRQAGPFIVTNAASLPVNLSEDELFGHEKGAFTGAHTRRKGCLELAHGGTLFLDEIADLDIQVQAKLLRVIETGQFTRLGGSEQIQVNVRIVAATHKDMETLVKEGTFRHDLWYRLCAFVVTVPSLSQRSEDVPLLAQVFLQTICKDMNMSRTLSSEALTVLKNAEFPGNVRELKHVITRAAVLSEEAELTEKNIVAVLSGQMRESSFAESTKDYSTLDFKNARKQFEIDYFSKVLKKSNNNITLSAATIGMAQSNLSRKLKELGLK